MRLTPNAQAAVCACFLLVLGVLGSLFLDMAGISALTGKLSFQFYADSGTYHQAAAGKIGHIQSFRDMVSMSSNYLGPVLILDMLDQSYYAVLWFNVLVFWFSLELIARATQCNRFILYAIFFLNPITLSSLLAINKELLSVLTIALLIYGLGRHSIWSLFTAVCMGLFVRWQFCVFILLAIFCWFGGTTLSRRRKIIIFLLFASSFMLWQFGFLISEVENGFWIAARHYDGSGFYAGLVRLQSEGLYWLIFIPKAAHLLFGLGLRFDRLIDPIDIYNDVWQLLHSLAMLIVFMFLLVRGKFTLKSNMVYLSVIYLIIFTMTPIYVPRYFYAVYIYWAIELAGGSLQRFGTPTEVKSPFAGNFHKIRSGSC